MGTLQRYLTGLLNFFLPSEDLETLSLGSNWPCA